MFKKCLLTTLFLLLLSNFCYAVDLGKDISLDGMLSIGKLWDVDFSNTDRTSTVSATMNKGEVYLEAEFGVRYKFARPFAGYQYLGGIMQDEVFSKKSLGVDWFPYELSKDVALGIRTSYNWVRVPDLLEHDYAYTGLIVKW